MPIGKIVTVLDSFEFETTYGDRFKVQLVSGNVYAIFYTATAGNLAGKVVTVEIVNGQITEPLIDSYEFESTYCDWIDVLKIQDNIYAIVFSGLNADIGIKTLGIANNGTITTPFLDSVLRSTTCHWPQIACVTGGMYLVCYHGPSTPWWAQTWTISGAGTISAAPIGTLGISDADLDLGNLLEIAHGIFLGSCSTSGYFYGWARTIGVQDDGTIDGLIDSLQFSNVGCETPFNWHIDGNVYATFANLHSNDGKIWTYEVAADGQIAASIIDSWVFSTIGAKSAHVIEITPNYYAMAYDIDWTTGYLKTFYIASDGTITKSFIDTYTYSTTGSRCPRIIHNAADQFTLVYQGQWEDGFLTTLDISTTATSIAHHELLLSLGP